MRERWSLVHTPYLEDPLYPAIGVESWWSIIKIVPTKESYNLRDS